MVSRGYSSKACRILPDQGSILCLLHSQEDSLPLSHQGSPRYNLDNEFIHPNVFYYVQISLPFSSVQSLNHVWLFATPWTAARRASLSISNSWSLLKLMSMESLMPSNHLILCRPLLVLPSIFPSIRVFSNESVLRIRWPKYWSFSISPSSEYSGLISFRMERLITIMSQSVLNFSAFYHTRLDILPGDLSGHLECQKRQPVASHRRALWATAKEVMKMSSVFQYC